MKKISVLSLAASWVAAFMIPAPFAQGQALPTVPALATSESVEIIGNVPGALFGLNFSGDYAYGTGPSGLTIFDISEPASPTVAGELPLPHFENEDVDVCGDLLVIANDAINPEAPLYVIDISDPMLPTIAGTSASAPREPTSAPVTSPTSSATTARRCGSTGVSRSRSYRSRTRPPRVARRLHLRGFQERSLHRDA